MTSAYQKNDCTQEVTLTFRLIVGRCMFEQVFTSGSMQLVNSSFALHLAVTGQTLSVQAHLPLWHSLQ